MSVVRTRIAPSPTGDPHLGTAYIALFNLCFARAHGGEFILRIEDTDQTRSSRHSEQNILEALRWLGLTWDEGPDIGGPCGPYRQSERKASYRQYAERLVANGHAFYCFRTVEELADFRAQKQAAGENTGFKLEHPELPEAEVQQRIAAGDSYVIRMKVPDTGVCQFQDELRGTVEIPWAQIDMQVLLKSDGMPTYHLANVVDDHLMKITHVIRGEEWINSGPKHMLLYQYFGWEVPKFYHLPLLRNPDKSKLSKRKNPTSILFYQRMGFLSSAVTNYLGQMGWSFPDERDKFTLSEMIAAFDINRVSLGGPIFDIEKLRWLNGRYIREDLSPDAFLQAMKEWAFDEEYLRSIAVQVKGRVELLSDTVSKAALFFNGFPEITVDSFTLKLLELEQVGQILQYSVWALDRLEEWDKEHIHAIFIRLSDHFEIKLKVFMAPIFVAMAGSIIAPPIMDAMVTIGSDLSRARLRNALNVLKMPSKKQVKKWQKSYDALEL